MAVNNKPVLIYPTEVSERAVGAIAYWYDETENVWNKIEDTYIEQNKVYGTLPKSAPVSVFLIKRATYIDNSKSIYPKEVFCANGVPVNITEQSDGTVIALDENGFKTILPEGTTVIGGTLDGEDIPLSSITVNGVTKLSMIHGGSHSIDRVSTLDNMEINITNCKNLNVTGAGNKNRVNNAVINIDNNKCTYIGIGQSSESDLTKPLDLTAETCVKNATVNCNDVTCTYAYLGGPNTGLVYIDNADITVTGGNYDNLLPCGANGKVNNVKMSIDGAFVDALSTINRGTVVNSNLIINNGNVNSLYCTGETEEDDVNGIINKVGIEVTNSTINRLTIGKNNGKLIETAEEAKSVITKLNLTNTTVTEYADNSETLLKDIIVIG